MMLDSIHTEHGYINRLLNILQQKLDAIENGRTVNYSLIKDIVEYLQQYAEHCHHPKEDILYHYYQSHYAKNGDMQSLEQEHHQLAQLTAEFADTVEMVLMDAVIPLDIFAEKLNVFVVRQKAHLEFEEKNIFPLIRRDFTAEDWVAVSKELQVYQDDPLFGEHVDARYQKLSEHISK
ncbi:cation-binding protein [Photobacterium profundum]|uniref:Hemerythrin-like domain-containing protein n=1 Tax=Photobacterium profundum 3TCK TaxID=314280 RepID=Q1Z181_9GAMM|nr:hemerythrin domain-containing protein [Photobacterium profundum]EAS42315.1 hypothetical protein P3TCK_13705 [Photobacterium profundum 3TCK]PSV60855.1 cation-binding protein [Photobacterium profundum]